MPITEKEAKDILLDVRMHFKWDLKSGNKWSQKIGDRKQQEANQRVGDWREYASTFNLTLQQRAEEVSLLGHGGRVGNCFEMSLMACREVQRRGEQEIWLGTISDPGDHVFCIFGALGQQPPPWPNANSMTQYAGNNIWIIDPWANIACTPNQYPLQFENKMGKWVQDGKWIWSDGAWALPGAAYVDGFGIGPLDYESFI